MFQQQKMELSNVLFGISHKISFPQKLLNNLNKASLGDISKLMENYNKNISKAKKLHMDLEAITEWGFFTNSYFFWDLSVKRVLSNDNIYKLQMANLQIVDPNGDLSDIIRNKILSQSAVNFKNLLAFMHIHKYETSYYIEPIDSAQYNQVKSPLSLNIILRLLPVCMIMEQGKSIFNCYHPIETLDEFDLISKKVGFNEEEKVES